MLPHERMMLAKRMMWYYDVPLLLDNGATWGYTVGSRGYCSMRVCCRSQIMLPHGDVLLVPEDATTWGYSASPKVPTILVPSCLKLNSSPNIKIHNQFGAKTSFHVGVGVEFGLLGWWGLVKGIFCLLSCQFDKLQILWLVNTSTLLPW